MLRGYSSEGRRYVRASLELPEVLASDAIHAHALYVGACLAEAQSNYAEAQRMLQACLALRRNLNSPIDIAASLSTLSLVRLHMGDADGARRDEEEAVTIFRSIENRIGEAIGLLHLGQIHFYFEDDARAHVYFEQCLTIAREIEYREIEREAELLLGESLLSAADLPGACARFTRSLEVCREAEDKRGEASALWWLGKWDLQNGDLEGARVRLNGALRAFQAFEMYEELLGCLEDHAELMCAMDALHDAVRVYASVDGTRERLTLRRYPRSQRRWSETIVDVRRELGDDTFDTRWSEGRGWSIDDAIKQARRRIENSATETEAAASA